MAKNEMLVEVDLLKEVSITLKKARLVIDLHVDLVVACQKSCEDYPGLSVLKEIHSKLRLLRSKNDN